MKHTSCLNFRLQPIFKSRFFLKFLIFCIFKLILISFIGVEVVGGKELVPVSIQVPTNPYVKFEEGNSKAIIVTDLATQVVIICHSLYPIIWNLEKYRYGSFPSELKSAIKFGSKREFTDFWNPSTYRFTSTMTLEASTNKLTGNYSCNSVDMSHPGEDYIYVYWEGSSGSYLLQAGENRKVLFEPNDKYFQLYCGTSKPSVQVYLFHGQKSLIPDNQTVFQNVDGFLVNINLLQELGVEEAFICSLKSRYNPNIDDTSEIARFEVAVSDNTKKKMVKLHNFHTMTQDSKGLVNYDTSINNLICCSQRADEHRQVGYYCRNPSECSFYWNRLMWGDNAQDRNATCSWYTEGFRGDNGAVVFRCDNRNDLEAEAEKFYGLNAKSYLNVAEASREKWNVISLKYNTTKAERLIRSSIQFECKHSTYLFSEGAVWAAAYQNGSIVIINKDNIRALGSHGADFRFERVWNEDGNVEWAQIRFFNRNVKQLSCLAPVWNSFEWWNSTVDLFVDESIPPKFEDNERKEIVSSDGSLVNLTCGAKGYPKPTISWVKDGKTISETNTLSTTEMPGNKVISESTKIEAIRVSSILTINVTQSTAGNYICTAKSDVGEDNKTFVVKIKDSTTMKVLGITAGVILILLLILGFSLRKIIQQRKAIQFLTQQEIEEFEKGNPDALAKLTASNEYTNTAHHLLPYNTDYEVPKDMLSVDYGVILGQGTYGMVLKGRLKRRGDEFDVAVKTIKPNEDASHFKVLLCEVKIMAYIGSHQNIVCLVGAYTRNIRNRELLVATEFCENGNLLETLRNARETFQNNFGMRSPKAIDNVECPGPDYANDIRLTLSTLELLKWSAEIATGMEFLGVKRVIHGDLACRNVLLSSNNVAKVGDFGLSKHLFQYSTYQKKTVQLLPWRWMALESLTDMVFSLQSDVWAYGVTLWEIFSLAQTPYPGMVWDEVFIKRLEDNYRLHQPQFASNELYELILSCWVRDPAQRPTFTSLKEGFYQTLITLRADYDKPTVL